jgi:hypothetical protein
VALKATLPDSAIPLVAGFVSAGLFLIVTALGLGFFFLFLPTLPILFLGLSNPAHKTLPAVLIASAVSALVAGIPAALMYTIFLGLPSWHIGKYALLSRADSTGGRKWYPMGLIFLNLTLYACAISATIIFYYAGEPGGIEQVIAKSMKVEFSDLSDEYGAAMNTLITQWAFLIFSMTIWLWGLALYAHTWVASRFLLQQKKLLRPSIAITPFAMPHGVLYLLAVCALASLIGSSSMQFFGKASLLALLFPYCLLGGAHMHQATKNWPSRRFFLFFVYFFVFAQFWPALILSGIGLWQHIKALSGRAASSKK